MFVGHLGAGLAAEAVNRRVNLGVLFGAAMLLAAVLWVLVLAGLERMNIPADHAARHYLTFSFPYSHSLLGAVLWGGGAALVWRAFARGAGAWAGGVIVALTVISHWVLDALAHAPELSPWGGDAPLIGLDLWDHQPWALVVEFAVAIAGLALYWRHARPRPWRGLGVAALVAVAGVFTPLGAFSTQPPPGVLPIASTSLVIIVIFTLLAGFADRTQGSAP